MGSTETMSAPLTLPPDKTTSVPPPLTVVDVAVVAFDTISKPPLSNFVPIDCALPVLRTSYPPLDKVVSLATPVLRTYCSVPSPTVMETVVPPEYT